MPVSYHSVFTGRMQFLPLNQERQSTEGISCKCWQWIWYHMGQAVNTRQSANVIEAPKSGFRLKLWEMADVWNYSWTKRQQTMPFFTCFWSLHFTQLYLSVLITSALNADTAHYRVKNWLFTVFTGKILLQLVRIKFVQTVAKCTGLAIIALGYLAKCYTFPKKVQF